jgi:hypothetical protein
MSKESKLTTLQRSALLSIREENVAFPVYFWRHAHEISLTTLQELFGWGLIGFIDWHLSGDTGGRKLEPMVTVYGTGNAIQQLYESMSDHDRQHSWSGLTSTALMHLPGDSIIRTLHPEVTA